MLLDRGPQQLVESGGVEAQGRAREALAFSVYVTQSQTGAGPAASADRRRR